MFPETTICGIKSSRIWVLIVSKLFQLPILGQVFCNFSGTDSRTWIFHCTGVSAPTPELFKSQLFMDLPIIYIANFFLWSLHFSPLITIYLTRPYPWLLLLYSNSWNQGIEPFKVCSFMFSFVLFWLFCVLCISIRILNLAWQFLQKKVFCSFTGDCSKAVDWFGENGYLNSITLPVHEHGKSYLHLFRSSLISHKNVLKFQFTCLAHFC